MTNEELCKVDSCYCRRIMVGGGNKRINESTLSTQTSIPWPIHNFLRGFVLCRMCLLCIVSNYVIYIVKLIPQCSATSKRRMT